MRKGTRKQIGISIDARPHPDFLPQEKEQLRELWDLLGDMAGGRREVLSHEGLKPTIFMRGFSFRLKNYAASKPRVQDKILRSGGQR
jgi:hypothetical protein